MKQFSRENSYIFPPNELKHPIFLKKKFLYKLLYFLEDLVDSLDMLYMKQRLRKYGIESAVTFGKSRSRSHVREK